MRRVPPAIYLATPCQRSPSNARTEQASVACVLAWAWAGEQRPVQHFNKGTQAVSAYDNGIVQRVAAGRCDLSCPVSFTQVAVGKGGGQVRTNLSETVTSST